MTLNDWSGKHLACHRSIDRLKLSVSRMLLICEALTPRKPRRGKQGCLPLQSHDMTDFNFQPKFARDDFGWHWRKLPHLDAAEFTQFITFRLHDSIPQQLIEKWRSKIAEKSGFRKRVEKFLDSGHGECLLRDEHIARVVADTLIFHDSKKYDLHSWVVMPNHAHVLLTPLTGIHLPDIMHSIKSYTAQIANKHIGRSGQFWQHESFDRYIRNWKHFAAVVRYIENNPVKAGLYHSKEEWKWGSAYGK